MALLLLVEELRRLGVRSAAVGLDGADRAIRLAGEELRAGQTLVVYPEPIRGNPLGATEVLRWVLYRVDPAVVSSWQRAGDRVAYYWPDLHPTATPELVLRTLDAGLQRFVDRGGARSGVCYRVGKGADYHPLRVAHEEDVVVGALAGVASRAGEEFARGVGAGPWPAVELRRGATLDQMVDLFNQRALFVSYDCASATSLLAALCGCASIIVPRPGMVRADLLPCFERGVGLGLGEVEFAVDQLRSVRAYCRSLEVEGTATVASLVERLGLRTTGSREVQP
jgi:hypothetical protein